MLYKRNAWGRRYIRVITGGPTLFLTFVIIGVLLFLFLTLTIKIDVINTYSATTESRVIMLSGNISDVPKGAVVYVYLNKNEAVYSVPVEAIELKKEGLSIYTNADGENILRSLASNSILVDIPQGKETLLSRIFVKGGKGHG